MAENEQNHRRFITRLDVEEASRSGTSISLGSRDVITDEANQSARDLNVTVSTTARPTNTEPTTRAAPTAHPGTSAARPDPELRSVVREAVIAELGVAPAQLDEALDKVFGGSER